MKTFVDFLTEDDREENYMFFANLETIKRHAEMLLALNKSQVDQILKDGHDWAQDHIATSKDDIEEVCNFFQNETKEKGSGVVPELKKENETVSENHNGQSLQLARLILKYLTDNNHLTPAAKRQLIGLEDDIADIIGVV